MCEGPFYEQSLVVFVALVILLVITLVVLLAVTLVVALVVTLVITLIVCLIIICCHNHPPHFFGSHRYIRSMSKFSYSIHNSFYILLLS